MPAAVKSFIPIHQDCLQANPPVREKTCGAQRRHNEDQRAVRFNIIRYCTDEPHKAVVEQTHAV